MNKYSLRSEEALATCHPDLQKVLRALLPVIDHTVICGYRDEAGQNAAVETGKSKAKWPTSKHNSLPSKAVDIAPYLVSVGTKGGIPWEDEWIWGAFAEKVFAAADNVNVKLKWGGEFKSFFDGPHFELEDE